MQQVHPFIFTRTIVCNCQILADDETTGSAVETTLRLANSYSLTRRSGDMEQGDAVILGNAIIWAAVIFGMAFVLTGTNYLPQLIVVVGGGAAASVVVVGGGVRRMQSAT